MSVANTVRVVGSLASMAALAVILSPVMAFIAVRRLWRWAELRLAYGGDEAARLKDRWRAN